MSKMSRTSQVLLISKALAGSRLSSLPREHTLVHQTPVCCKSNIVLTSQAVATALRRFLHHSVPSQSLLPLLVSRCALHTSALPKQ